jgi:uncharacterized alkaline shock family protein YloU
MEEWGRGEIRVADQVIAVIAGLAAQDIPGIIMRSGGLYQDLARRVNGSSPAKGITVSMTDGQIRIEMRVAVTYGSKIHEVCKQLQEQVKEKVEFLTGLSVEEVNIRVETLASK